MSDAKTSLVEQSSDPYTGGRWVSYWVDHLVAALQLLKQNRQALAADPMKDATAKLGDVVLTFTQQLRPIVSRLQTYLDTSKAVAPQQQVPPQPSGKSTIPGGIPSSPVNAQLPSVPNWGPQKRLTVSSLTQLGTVLSEISKVTKSIRPEDLEALEETATACLADLTPWLLNLDLAQDHPDSDTYREVLDICEGLVESFEDLDEAAKLGSGARFKSLKKKLAAKGDVKDPGAVAAAIGRKKHGKEKFQKLAAKGKKESVDEALVGQPTKKWTCTRCGVTMAATPGQAKPNCPKCQQPMGEVTESTKAEVLDSIHRIVSE